MIGPNWPVLAVAGLLLVLFAFAWQPEKRFLESLDEEQRRLQTTINWAIVAPLFLLLLALGLNLHTLGLEVVSVMAIIFGLWLLLVAWNFFRRYRILQGMVRMEEQDLEDFRKNVLEPLSNRPETDEAAPGEGEE